MDSAEFFERVRERLDGDDADAQIATRGTLHALGQQLATREAEDLAAQLPRQLGEWVRNAGAQHQAGGAGEFYERVATFAGGTPEQAERLARAVLGVLAEAVNAGELTQLTAQLPPELTDLLAARGTDTEQ